MIFLTASLYNIIRVQYFVFKFGKNGKDFLSPKSNSHYRAPIYVAIAAMGAKCLKDIFY